MSLSSLADAHTEVRNERITYTWSIKGSNVLPPDADGKILSPLFYSRNKSEKWKLEFHPHGDNDNDYVALYLARESPGKSLITVHTEMKISKSKKILKHLSFIQEYQSHESSGWPKFLERSKLFTTNSSNDDKFTISCIITIPVDVITMSCDTTIFDLKKSQLSDHFRLLFEDPKFSDFTIIVGDKKFATHKLILASRSPVFAAMFEHKDVEENRKKKMKIDNMESDVIRGMLEFIYTDQVTNIKKLASELLEAADKYDLENLRIMCEKVLYERVNKENAAEILLLADLYRADTLKKYVMKYIVTHAPELIESSNWKKNGWSLELFLELIDQLALSQAANNEES